MTTFLLRTFFIQEDPSDTLLTSKYKFGLSTSQSHSYSCFCEVKEGREHNGGGLLSEQ